MKSRRNEIVYGRYYIEGEERESAVANLKHIKDGMARHRNHYICLGRYLKEAYQMKYEKDFGYQNFYEFCDRNFKIPLKIVFEYVHRKYNDDPDVQEESLERKMSQMEDVVYGPDYVEGKERELAVANFECIKSELAALVKQERHLNFYMCEIYKRKYYRDFGYKSLYQYCKKNLGIDRNMVIKSVNNWLIYGREEWKPQDAASET